MRKTSQDGGDNTSITSGIENENKKTGGILKNKRNSIKKKVANFSNESDDGIIEPLLQKDKTEPSNRSAKNVISKTKTEPIHETNNEKEKLMADDNVNKPSISNVPSITGVFTNGIRDYCLSKFQTCSAAPIHNHMNTNVFNSHNSTKNNITTINQILVEIDSCKSNVPCSTPLIFTTAKIHSDNKSKHMEPFYVTPIPILSTIEGNAIKSGIVSESDEIEYVNGYKPISVASKVTEVQNSDDTYNEIKNKNSILGKISPQEKINEISNKSDFNIAKDILPKPQKQIEVSIGVLHTQLSSDEKKCIPKEDSLKKTNDITDVNKIFENESHSQQSNQLNSVTLTQTVKTKDNQIIKNSPKSNKQLIRQKNTLEDIKQAEKKMEPSSSSGPIAKDQNNHQSISVNNNTTTTIKSSVDSDFEISAHPLSIPSIKSTISKPQNIKVTTTVSLPNGTHILAVTPIKPLTTATTISACNSKILDISTSSSQNLPNKTHQLNNVSPQASEKTSKNVDITFSSVSKPSTSARQNMSSIDNTSFTAKSTVSTTSTKPTVLNLAECIGTSSTNIKPMIGKTTDVTTGTTSSTVTKIIKPTVFKLSGSTAIDTIAKKPTVGKTTQSTGQTSSTTNSSVLKSTESSILTSSTDTKPTSVISAVGMTAANSTSGKSTEVTGLTKSTAVKPTAGISKEVTGLSNSSVVKPYSVKSAGGPGAISSTAPKPIVGKSTESTSLKNSRAITQPALKLKEISKSSTSTATKSVSNSTIPNLTKNISSKSTEKSTIANKEIEQNIATVNIARNKVNKGNKDSKV